jgi:transposase-like protein
MSGRKGMMHYRVEIKQEAVRLVLEEHLTYATVATRLGAKRFEVWARMYREEGELSFHKPIGMLLKSQAEELELERLRMENALLKKFRLRECGSRSAISGDLSLQRGVQGESHM